MKEKTIRPDKIGEITLTNNKIKSKFVQMK